MVDTKVLAVSEAELDVAFSGPALAANRFFIIVGPGGVRITFAEEAAVGKPSYFRNAVMVPHQDAINLANILKSLLAPIEAQLDQAKKGAQGA